MHYKLIALLSLLLFTLASQAETFRCTDKEESPHYQNKPCTSNHTEGHPIETKNESPDVSEEKFNKVYLQ
ncbi:MAG: DUF4124 domain-containing protein [Candidatus Thiodiazotropha sp. (ex Monitilora ramsayi)]|nr:DUF4124 domain-containing protein [Candidatus Thiodiazotropha sp. (ex Monitilora ramsayi)]